MTPEPLPRAVHALEARSLAVVAAALLAFSAPAGGPIARVDARDLYLADAPSELDSSIRDAIRRGRLSEAATLVRNRLSARPERCVPYRLAIDVAQRASDLDRQAREWEEELKESESPFVLWGYAVALYEKGEDGRALNLLSRAMALGIPCVDAYRRFVRASQRAGALREAEVRLRQLERERTADPFVLHALAFLDEVRGEGRSAIAQYLSALLRATPLPDTYYALSVLLSRAGDYRRALNVSRLGSALARRSGHPDAELDFTLQQAELLAWLGEKKESDQLFDRELSRARADADGAIEVRILLQRSGLASALGDPAGARAFQEQADRVPVESPTPVGRALLRLRRGQNLLALGRPTAARAHLEEALRLAREAKEPFTELDALLGLVHVTTALGTSVEALQRTQAALETAVRLEDGPRQASALLAAAAVYESTGRFDRALDFLRRVLARARRDADLTREVLALSNLSLVHVRLGLAPQAVRFAEEAQERSGLLRDFRVRLGVAQSLGAALAGAGRFEDAARVFRAALDDSDRLAAAELKGLIIAGLGRVLLALGRAEDAEAVFQRGLDLSLDDRGGVVALQSRSGLGLALRQQGRLGEALAELEACLSHVESSRSALEDEAHRLRYAETRAQIYSNLTGVLIELDRSRPGAGYGERAFGVTERSRSRALLDMVSRAERRDVRELVSPEPLSSREVRENVLQEGEILLEYALGERESTLWAISSTESRRYALPPRREIESDVRLFLLAVRTPPRAPFKAFGEHLPSGLRLHRTLIAPASELLERASRVIVSPHGALHLLPFEALPRELADGSTGYLVEQVVVSYSPSASTLQRLRERSRRTGTPDLAFLGFAQPRPRLPADAQRSSYPAIPFATLEIESISGLFPADERKIYSDADSSEAAFKGESLRRYRVLHFAAHAEADSLFPERSAIVVGTGEGSGEDGLLRMTEVLGLELASELVVLSGCETGLGQVLEAEGTLGLTWAFLSAGSSAVAVSLWNVNDRSTSTLMTTFYGQMAGGRSQAEALAEAKRAMLRSSRRAYRHPFFWAPFVLVGLGADGSEARALSDSRSSSRRSIRSR